MDEINFEIVRPCESHAKVAMEWRNDPNTLAMSFHTAPKVWEMFYPEFCDTYFTLPDLPPLFALVNGERVAFVRFRSVSHPRRRCCEISLNVSPEHRKKGIGTQILKTLNTWVKGQGYHDILAEIKRENTISCKTFEKAGYALLEESDTVCRYLSPLAKEEEFKPVFIIAEVGSNWRVGKDDLVVARQLIDVAAEAGCDAVKFQTYRPETLYVPNAGSSDYLADSGIKEDIYSLLSNYAMPYEMIPKLAQHCSEKQIHFMSTPFSVDDFYAVDPHVLYHKIASYEISHPHLIRLAAESGKPTFMSTGAANEDDIDWAVDYYRSCGGQNLTLMQCTAKYPAKPNHMNLCTIPYLSRRYGVPVGLSDHSSDPIGAPVAAVALGATVIEKHFTLDRSLSGPDHAFAIIPDELKAMVLAIRETEAMLGTGVKQILPSEKELYGFARRGVQAVCDIKEGDIFSEEKNIAILRPGKQRRGVHPRHLSDIEGKKAKRNIFLGCGIQKEDY